MSEGSDVPGAATPGGLAGRAGAMATRVLRTAAGLGTPSADLPLIEEAHRVAMEPRERAGLDDHDPAFLHPGRSALVLMLDAGEARAEALAAALLVETERPELRVGGERIAAVLGWPVARAVADVPLPDEEALAERLVSAAEQTRLVALAERLDQLRHAHLWSDTGRRRRAHALVVEVYLPIASRTHPALERRYAWWCRMFERRWLG